MFKRVVRYEDYNGDPAEETLYFNITRTEVVDLLDIRPRFEAWIKKAEEAKKRDLTEPEILDMLDIIKTLIDASYGVRSDDGKKFTKSAELLNDFKQTAVYDAFVFEMFENPEKAVEFMVSIFPKQLVEQAKDEQIKNGGPSVVTQLPGDETSVQTAKKFEDYSRKELLEMSQPDFQKLVGIDPNKMSRDVLTLAYERKSRAISE